VITNEIQYENPRDLKSALELLEKHGDGAKVLAGGMSMVPMMTLGLMAPDTVISLNHIEGLGFIRDEGDVIAVGATTRHADVASSALLASQLPLLAETAALIGDVQVRNRGTLGGSISHADPGANYPSCLLALDAKIELTSLQGTREVAAKDFFIDMLTTDMRENELVTTVRFAKSAAGSGCSFQKFTRVTGNFPIVCAAAIVNPDKKTGSLGIGGVSRAPIFIPLADVLHATSKAERKQVMAANVAAAIDEPMADLNGSGDYKLSMATVYALRAVEKALQRVGQTQ
jgi:aerobic carbon-monoxide dehydrogenase medium subunit